MEAVGYLAALGLAVVLAVAAAGKWREPQTAAASMAALGVPRAGLVARILPAVEVGTAIALVTYPRVGAAVALVLLVAFTVVLVPAVRNGSGVACACFGGRGVTPVSSVELVRNALLLVAAAAALATATPVRPTIEAVVLVSTSALIGAVVHAMAAVRRDVGAVWKVALAGEERA